MYQKILSTVDRLLCRRVAAAQGFRSDAGTNRATTAAMVWSWPGLDDVE